jgi:methyl-accepting chemotaxis protein
MKWFRNLRIGFKVILCCVILIVFICLVSIASFRSGERATATFQKFFTKEFVPITDLNGIVNNMLQMRINMLIELSALQNKNNEEADKRILDTAPLGKENNEKWERYKNELFSAEGKKLAGEWETLYLETEKIRVKCETAIQNRNIKEAAVSADEWVSAYRKSRDKTNELIQSKMNFARTDMKDQKNDAENNFIMNVLLLSFAMGCGILVTVVLSLSVSRPVAKGLSFAKKLAAGNFTERINLDQKDELGQLAKALNIAADDLEKMVADILTGSQNLVQAVQEISSGNENLSQRTSEQASSLEEVAATIEETTSSINQNADNAKNANELSAKMSIMAEEGGRVVLEAVLAINEISEASKKIEEIITVINEIAFQTNLLALNAAVEAARAGEQGRGFAVVAGEVRNLAQRSGSAAKEISSLIKETLAKVEKGTQLSNKSGESLSAIIVSVKNVNRLVSEIDAATNEQKQGTSQINIAVSELDSMTQQNAGLVEETASASEEMANQAQELLTSMERFSIRQELKTVLDMDKIRNVNAKSSDKKALSRKSGNIAG